MDSSSVKLKLPKKDVVKADAYRRTGNEHFEKREMDLALECYNNSILLVSDCTPEYAYAFGNRSALFFEVEAYSECLRDIDRAKSCSACPDDLKEKLLRRRNKCIKILGNDLSKLSLRRSSSDGPFPQLRNGSNPNVPDISRDIVMEHDPVMGRRLVAAKDIEPGSVLIIERPYATVLVDPTRTTHCHHCHELLPMDFIPCKRCSDVRYCAEECYLSSRMSHQMECQAVNLLFDTGISYLAYKIFIAAADKDLAEVFICPHGEMDRAPEGTYGTEPGVVYDGSFRCLWNLMSHNDMVKPEDYQNYKLAAQAIRSLAMDSSQWSAIVSNLFQAPTGICDECKSVTDAEKSDIAGRFVLGTLIRLIETSICNAHAITGMVRDQESEYYVKGKLIEKRYETRIASAIYPTASLMNHSCQPNIMSSFIGKTLIVRAVKPIKAGEEILNCYGPQFGRMLRPERRASLKEQYNFFCQCSACMDEENCNREYIIFAEIKACPSCSCTVPTIPEYFVIGPSSRKKLCPMSEDKKRNEFECSICHFRVPLEWLPEIVKKMEGELESLMGGEATQDHSTEKKALQLLDNLGDYLFPYNKVISSWRDRVSEWLMKKGTKSGMRQALKLLQFNLNAAEFIYGSGIEWANEVIKFMEVAEIALSEDLDDVSLASHGKHNLRRLAEKTKTIFATCYGSSCHQIEEVNELEKRLFEVIKQIE